MKWISEAWADEAFKRNLFISACSTLLVLLCILLVGSCRDHVVYVYEPFLEIPESDNNILNEDISASRGKIVFEDAKAGNANPLDFLNDYKHDLLESTDPLDFLKDPVGDSIREAKRQEDLKFFGLSSTEKDSLQSRKRDSLMAENVYWASGYEPTDDFLDTVYDTLSDRPLLIAVLAFGVLGVALVFWIIMTLLLAPFQWISRKCEGRIQND